MSELVERANEAAHWCENGGAIFVDTQAALLRELAAALSRAEADAESERLRNGSTHWHARANTWFKRHQIVSARASRAEAQRDALAKALAVKEGVLEACRDWFAACPPNAGT